MITGGIVGWAECIVGECIHSATVGNTEPIQIVVDPRGRCGSDVRTVLGLGRNVNLSDERVDIASETTAELLLYGLRRVVQFTFADDKVNRCTHSQIPSQVLN